jgi:hypothetical protein
LPEWLPDKHRAGALYATTAATAVHGYSQAHCYVYVYTHPRANSDVDFHADFHPHRNHRAHADFYTWPDRDTHHACDAYRDFHAGPDVRFHGDTYPSNADSHRDAGSIDGHIYAWAYVHP